MRKAFCALSLVLVCAAAAAAQSSPTRVLTTDGSVLNGSITGGTVTLKTTLGGDVSIDPRRIHTLSGTTVTLDDGSVVQGKLSTGAMQFASVFGTFAIPVDRVAEIQTSKRAPVKVTTAAIQIVNDTRRNLSVCLNDEMPCLTLGPNGSTTRTLLLGQLRMRVESTTQLGPVVLATGNFEKSMAVDKDTTVRVTESDFR